MQENNSNFESLIYNGETDLGKESKKIIDQFLVEISYLPELIPGEIDMSREWDIEYNKIIISLSYLESFEEFEQFHDYVWNKMTGFIPKDKAHHKIWENRTLWVDKYLPKIV